MKKGRVLEIYDALFDHQTKSVFGRAIVTMTMKGGSYVRKVEVDGLLFLTQNPERDSTYAEMARKGVRICWIKRDDEFRGKVVNREIFVNRRKE
jgi:hypothetical protein